jgi:hypothetical protein
MAFIISDLQVISYQNFLFATYRAVKFRTLLS